MNFFQRIKLRRQVKQHINRPLDIREIISRESDTNVVIDAYEFFMRKYHWEIDECDSPYVKIFLLCVRYDGEIANGEISETDAMMELDTAAYNTDICSFCYQYLTKNKTQFLTNA